MFLTDDQADGESHGTEERPESEVMPEGFTGQTLWDSGVVLLTADAVLGGGGDGTKSGQLHCC